MKMDIISLLILFPFAAALLLAFMKKQGRFRSGFVFFSCSVIIAATVYFSVTEYITSSSMALLLNTHTIDIVMSAVELLMMGIIVYYAVKKKKYYIILLSAAQTGLMAWLEFSGGHELPETAHIYSDKLSIMMCAMVGIVGSLICVYAVGYMKEYHTHHTEYRDRSNLFFAILFVFMGAMFGIIFSNNLTWMYFFWEITTLCSFLLIGYTQTEEATNNAFRALWMNLLGGLAFASAIVYCNLRLDVGDLHGFLLYGKGDALLLAPLALLAFAALTKSAQLPFSQWLLGAMVAPTPTSALLHSATMVKAGVYLLIRLAPLMTGNLVGVMVTTIGGFTFFATSVLAISQSDAKKVLAYSTISNLGLITACAGIGMFEAVWAGILLMLFHAVSKSLMFLTVGAVENSLGSRNIEDMHGLIVKLPGLAFFMFTGIAGMFLAPFGMLISKWAALKAYVDSGNMLMVVFLVFGSATTLFYWSKWLGTIVAVLHNSSRLHYVVGNSQWISLVSHVLLLLNLCLLFPVVSTDLVEPFLTDMYHMSLPPIISEGNTKIMIMMLFAIVILPIAVRFLTFRKKQKIVISYMGGANTGDDRHFTDSFGEEKPMYLANWYMDNWFGEKRILKPSILASAAVLLALMGVVIGGAL